MKQSVSHSAGALIWNFNVLILKALCMKPLFIDSIHCNSFRLHLSYSKLGQRRITWHPHLHTKKCSPSPTPTRRPLPLFFLFFICELLWLGAREPASAAACCATFLHLITTPTPTPPPPYSHPPSSHHAHEGKQNWHVSLMRSPAPSMGKELLFPHTLKFSSSH